MLDGHFKVEEGLFGEHCLFKRVPAYEERLCAFGELCAFPFWVLFILFLDGTASDVRDFFVGRVLTLKSGVYHDGSEAHPRYREVH